MKQHLLNDSLARRLRAGKPVSAAWAQLGSNVSAEIFAEAGFDALIIDMEHGPWDMQNTLAAMQACKGTGCVPFVRVPWNDMVWCKRALDLGAGGVHVPYISTREEAEYAVRCCKYPTAGGVRGIAGSQRAVCYGLDKADYYARADRDIVVMLAIESPEGVANIDAIAAVEGVDGIFIGPSDLSTTMGHLADPSQPDVQAAIRTIEAAAKAHGRFLGTIAPDFEGAKKLYDRGYSLVYFMSDTTSLSVLARGAVQAFKDSYPE
ncbi:HpcH/HpaI aldolase family protein [Allofournierella sp.]|uniref:HpcH/HpaI aldolase family protein n=1 Tax=Allofournierella sp. TaxID=1940256 RepID=UPI003AB7BAD8